jgi:hypothetical protein
MVQGSTAQELSIHKNSIKVFEQLLQRAVFQASTTVVDLGEDSSSSDDEESILPTHHRRVVFKLALLMPSVVLQIVLLIGTSNRIAL